MSQLWSLGEPWNKALDSRQKDRPFGPRDVLYASEIGAEFLEVYWRLHGIEPTNIRTVGALRKMEAGNFYEAVVVWVLQRCGVLKKKQGKVRLFDEKYLPVYGRYDILAGADGNWVEKKESMTLLFAKLEGAVSPTREIVEQILSESGHTFSEDAYTSFMLGVDYAKLMGFDFPFFDIVKKMSYSVIDYLAEKYPEGLEDKIIEVKSINSVAFWSNGEMISAPYEHHIKQLTFYLKYNDEGVKTGSFVYIDRDTMSISELFMQPNENVVNEILAWLEKMTYYYRNNIEPPKPDVIVLDEKSGKYQMNWKIGWSDYKDKLLEGQSEEDIKIEIKKLNSESKEIQLLDLALRGKVVYGNKKFIQALDAIKSGLTDVDVVTKFKISKRSVDYLIEKSSHGLGKQEI